MNHPPNLFSRYRRSPVTQCRSGDIYTGRANNIVHALNNNHNPDGDFFSKLSEVNSITTRKAQYD